MRLYVECLALGALAGALWPGLARKINLALAKRLGGRGNFMYVSWYPPGVHMLVLGCLVTSFNHYFCPAGIEGGIGCILFGAGLLLGVASSFHP